MEQGVETKSSPKAEALLKFAAHVRDVPDSATQDAAELAMRFGLPIELVEQSLAIARSGRASVERKKRRSILEYLSGIGRSACLYIAKHPLIAAGIVSAVFFTTYKYIATFAPKSQDIYGIVSLLLGLTALFGINLIRGQARYAVYTSVVAVAVSTFGAYIIDILLRRRILTADLMQDSIFKAIVLMILLSACFSVGAILGALLRLRRRAKEEENLDRLQLLQRVFNLQDRLTAAPQSAKEEIRFRAMLQTARGEWVWIAIACGLLTGFLTIIQIVMFGEMSRNPSVIEQSFALLALLLHIALYPFIGFVAGNLWKGVVAGLIATAANFLIWFLPIPGLGLDQLLRTLQESGAILINVGILTLMSAIGGLGAAIDERLEHQRKLDAADQAATLTEIIRLQQLLQTGSAEVCVMVVDCVKSTLMKKDADPLAVEISFREFHEFVAREVHRHNGNVHSTAGDGVVAEFASVQNAFQAARQLQTLITVFNAKSNKLAAPFKLRIGLHCGPVHGGLEQVLFASVIDIAAHIEKAAPTGGIIVSQDVRNHLPEHEFVPMADQIDGVNVFLAKSPTLD